MKNAKDKKFLKELGKHLKKQRRLQGLSQHDLAFNAGVDKNVIGNLERGEDNPKATTLRALATALNLPLKDVFNF